mmetsp:Transcript_126367/g.319103  ORF Transcript_126367/g.319103 Transcript_126367/m.319103 type:complete len:205 (+) Transcript_126367:690-1304(+)
MVAVAMITRQLPVLGVHGEAVSGVRAAEPGVHGVASGAAESGVHGTEATSSAAARAPAILAVVRTRGASIGLRGPCAIAIAVERYGARGLLHLLLAVPCHRRGCRAAGGAVGCRRSPRDVRRGDEAQGEESRCGGCHGGEAATDGEATLRRLLQGVLGAPIQRGRLHLQVLRKRLQLAAPGSLLHRCQEKSGGRALRGCNSARL